MDHFDAPVLMHPPLIHVAAAAENRGRVVLAARTGAPHRIAISAAAAVANAFESWLECLIIEDPRVSALTAHSFAREVALSGRRIAPLSSVTIADHQNAESVRARRVLLAAAEKLSVRMEIKVVGETISDALAAGCLECGPWNMIALAEPVQTADGPWLHRLLDEVVGATGLVFVGPKAAASAGPVVVVVEDIERLPQMLRAAERLAMAGQHKRIVLLLACAKPERTFDLEGIVRLALPESGVPERVRVDIVGDAVPYGTVAETAEALRVISGGFVVARNGGLTVPADGNISALMLALKCPVLLVR